MIRRPMKSFLAAVLGCLVIPTAAAAIDSVNEITVSAGTIDRPESIVTFRVDPAKAGGYLDLAADGMKGSTPLQVRPDGRASFIVRDLKAGQSRTYKVIMIKRAEAPRDTITANQKAGAIDIAFEGKDVLIYHGEKVPAPEGFGKEFDRGGYIELVFTPAGIRVTDDYPPGHKHHHGIWAPWTAARFEDRKVDFWNMGQKTGTVEFVAFGKTWSGRVVGGFTAKQRFMDLSAKPEPKAALNETWQVDVYAVGAKEAGGPKYRLFDWQSTQTCASDIPLLLPKYYYGGLGFRGNREWDGKDGCTMITSEGKTRANGNETTAKWIAIAGKVEGKPAYCAILCSPSNFRFPQPVRLHPKEPFMCYAPQQAGDMAIEPGKPYVMNYRFVVGDGEPDKAQLDRLWADYAEPMKAEVK